MGALPIIDMFSGTGDVSYGPRKAETWTSASAAPAGMH